MADNKSIYQTLLGSLYDDLPPSLQRLHQNTTQVSYQGTCNVTVGSHPLARLMRKMVALPKAGQNLPLQVDFVANGEVRQYSKNPNMEKWTRYFDGQPFVSTQWQDGQFLYEKVVFLTFVFQVLVQENRLYLKLKKIHCANIPLTWLGLHIEGEEWEVDGFFHFRVAVKMPFLGEVITYQGRLLVD